LPIGCRPSLRRVADSLASARSLLDLADDIRVGSRLPATGPRGFPPRFDSDPPPRGVRSSTTLLISGSSPEPLLRARTVARERASVFLSWGSHPRAPRSTPGGNRPSIDHPGRFTAQKAGSSPRSSHLIAFRRRRDRARPLPETACRFPRPRRESRSPVPMQTDSSAKGSHALGIPVPTSWSCTTSPGFSARGRRRRRLLPILGFAAFQPW